MASRQQQLESGLLMVLKDYNYIHQMNEWLLANESNVRSRWKKFYITFSNPTTEVRVMHRYHKCEITCRIPASENYKSRMGRLIILIDSDDPAVPRSRLLWQAVLCDSILESLPLLRNKKFPVKLRYVVT